MYPYPWIIPFPMLALMLMLHATLYNISPPDFYLQRKKFSLHVLLKMI